MELKHKNSEKKQEKDDLYENHPYGMRSVAESLDKVKKYKGKDVLVAGCGAGSRLFDLFFCDANVTGIDQSESSIQFISSQFEQLGYKEPNLIAGDLLDVELAPDQFDYILCHGVLHHTIKPRRILEKFNKWLKPDGQLEVLLYHTNSFVRSERRLVESVNNICNIGRFLPEKLKKKIEWWDKYENPVWETYSKDEARDLLESASFVIEDLWMANTVFGQFTNFILPPVVKNFLEDRLSDHKWHIRIEAQTLE